MGAKSSVIIKKLDAMNQNINEKNAYLRSLITEHSNKIQSLDNKVDDVVNHINELTNKYDNINEILNAWEIYYNNHVHKWVIEQNKNQSYKYFSTNNSIPEVDNDNSPTDYGEHPYKTTN
jgi:uncharacterized coiled-coil DUF342 family protein